jgi:hypothetical protein
MVGFEIELMAPHNRSRRDLAEKTARRVGGTVSRFFHPDCEPAIVEGQDLFENLTPGFKVSNSEGEWIASFVDDLTLQDGLNRGSKPKSGWYRIVSDDNRIIRLIEEQCNAEAPLKHVLQPLADLFGTKLETHKSGMVRFSDKRNVSVAIAAPLPGERERPCEIITAPIITKHKQALSALLQDALDLGFNVPRESATHIHFDAKPLRSALFVSRFVTLVSRFGPDLRALMQTNPACVRLGPVEPEVVHAVADPNFLELGWRQARETLSKSGLTKYCDYNLVNLVNQTRGKDTLEIRILPGLTDAREIITRTRFFEAILRFCIDSQADIPFAIEELKTILVTQDCERRSRSICK